VRPDGKGLREGRGTVAHGKSVYEETCAACHGANGQGGIKDRLVGGQGTLVSDKPIKTVGSFWPYATTLFDYINRAMPYQAPGWLSVDDTYAVAAYILNLNGILPEEILFVPSGVPPHKRADAVTPFHDRHAMVALATAGEELFRSLGAGGSRLRRRRHVLNRHGAPAPARAREDWKLDKETLPKIKMPNRDGFIPEPEFRKITSSK
jgi:hypothetical protein